MDTTHRKQSQKYKEGRKIARMIGAYLPNYMAETVYASQQQEDAGNE